MAEPRIFAKNRGWIVKVEMCQYGVQCLVWNNYKQSFSLPPFSAKTFEIDSLWSDILVHKEMLQQWERDTRPSDQSPRIIEAVVRITTNSEPIKVSILSEDPDFSGNSTLDGKQHTYYQSDETCENEFVYAYNTSGEGLVTLINDTKEDITTVDVEFELRDQIFIRDNANSLVVLRAGKREYQDDIGSAVREGTWDEANLYCTNLPLGGKSDWRLPNQQEAAAMYHQERTEPVFLNSNNEAYYWTSTQNTALANREYYTIKGNGGSGELSTTGSIASGADRHYRCVRDREEPSRSNFCELP